MVATRVLAALALVLAASTSVQAQTTGDLSTSGVVMDKTMLMSAAAQLSDYHSREEVQCKTEIADVQAWNREINDGANSRAADRDERLKSKRDLLTAVQARRDELAARINELSRLADAINGKIDQVNVLFTGSFKALKSSQIVASQALHGVGKSLTTAFRPIQLPSIPATANPASAALIEENSMLLEAKAQQMMAACEGEGCRGAYAAAYNLYKNAHSGTEANWNLFERQRASLKAIRQALEDLLARKRAKLAKLTNQAATIAAELNAANPITLSGVLSQLKMHEMILTSSCQDMRVNGDRSVKEVRTLAGDIFDGATGAAYDSTTAGATGAATGAATGLSAVPDISPTANSETPGMSAGENILTGDTHTEVSSDFNMGTQLSLDEELKQLDSTGINPIDDSAPIADVNAEN